MPARDAYDRWAPTYPALPHNALMQAEQAAVTPWLAGRGLARVLDAGAGTGRYTKILRATGAHVVSLDWSLAMLQRHTTGATRVCGDGVRLPFADGVFDLVNASLMAGDVKDLVPWLREMSRVLIPGGRVVYSDFHPAWHTRGLRRTFRDESGATIELPCEPHTLNDHLRARVSAGLQLEGMREIDVVSPPGFLDRCLGRTRPIKPGLLVTCATKAGGAAP